MLAATLADAMRVFVPDLEFSGIGGERMRAAGFRITSDTRGWASIGPLEALLKIPPLFVIAGATRSGCARSPRALIVLVDFGGFNLRFARALRAHRLRAAHAVLLPPGAWLDQPDASARGCGRRASADGVRSISATSTLRWVWRSPSSAIRSRR